VTAHVTLNVFRVENDKLEEAKVILQEVFKTNIEQLKPEGPVTFKSFGMFSQSVLFAKPNIGIEFLQRAHDILLKTTLT
jgi:nucleoid DNA-binding protein